MDTQKGFEETRVYFSRRFSAKNHQPLRKTRRSGAQCGELSRINFRRKVIMRRVIPPVHYLYAIIVHVLITVYYPWKWCSVLLLGIGINRARAPMVRLRKQRGLCEMIRRERYGSVIIVVRCERTGVIRWDTKGLNRRQKRLNKLFSRNDREIQLMRKNVMPRIYM